MTPNELADYLDQNVEASFACEQVHIDEAAAMLRHKQAAIELLNAEIERLKIALAAFEGWE